MVKGMRGEMSDLVRKGLRQFGTVTGGIEGSPQEYGKTGLMIELLQDLWLFMREHKKFWLAPIIIVMVLLGGLIVLAQGSAVAPFIYTLF